jgi:hypothetical protein
MIQKETESADSVSFSKKSKKIEKSSKKVLTFQKK